MAVLPIAAPTDLPPAIPAPRARDHPRFGFSLSLLPHGVEKAVACAPADLELDRTTDATEQPNELLEGDAIETPPPQIRYAGLIGAYQRGRIRCWRGRRPQGVMAL